MKNQQGFTLIEMSIVLVIIGLIVAGILLGQTLIRQAEMRSLISDVDKIRTAINTFEEKYNCLPGDCLYATDYWGTNPNCAAGTAGTGTETCNGNGDGNINFGALDISDASVAGNIEPFLFWQHLANAGLWPGTFTGVSAGSTYWSARVAVNIPASKVTGGGGYEVADFSSPYSVETTEMYATVDYSRVMLFGGNYPTSGTTNTGNFAPVLTGTEMLALDTKIDDGLPASGTVTTFAYRMNDNLSLPACVDNSDYIVGDTVACQVLFGKMWQ